MILSPTIPSTIFGAYLICGLPHGRRAISLPYLENLQLRLSQSVLQTMYQFFARESVDEPLARFDNSHTTKYRGFLFAQILGLQILVRFIGKDSATWQKLMYA